MKAVYLRHRKLLLVLGLILLAAALVWAAAELSGQANSLAQDAGSNSADMEMVTLNTSNNPQKQKIRPNRLPVTGKKNAALKRLSTPMTVSTNAFAAKPKAN